MAVPSTSIYAVAPHEHKEGEITKAIEHYTSQVPSGAYLSLAVGSIGLSLGPPRARPEERLAVRRPLGPDSILMLGLYNKLVKVEGSE